MGWEALKQWGDDVTRMKPLTGGVANRVWSVRVKGQLAIGRLGARSNAHLAWETDLLRHLNREGLMVPVPIATMDDSVIPTIARAMNRASNPIVAQIMGNPCHNECK